ncbi:YhcH/YjgK/YiaL family protein [Desulfobacterium sp. N47]|uniref:Protein yiaL n=1 Tax=uncultured Desulfobacterium sp. TaxID=201089 RepID=E1YIP3_9BACT|nr:Protein yiaL [uncultured Desulfobacterium sp.]
MIIDSIDNIEIYSGLGNEISTALRYIATADFNNMEPGKYDIDGDNIFVIISDYSTRHSNECRLEAHRKYIDVQYVAKGVEWVGYAPLENQAPAEEYDDKKDCAFFEEKASFIKLGKGMFAIFFPTDIHMPGTADKPAPVRKAVVKVRLYPV